MMLCPARAFVMASWLCFAGITLIACGGSGDPAITKPKHIIFLMIDDLGFNDVSYHGTSDLSSPNIDALANAGVRLARYYTHNLCSPSRTAFLSGRFASSIGMQACVIVNGRAVALPRNVSTVADRLRAAGFRTAAIGKWDAGMTTWDYTPTCRGFDYFFGYYAPAEDHYTHTFDGYLDLRENFEPVRDAGGIYSTHLFTSKAQTWISRQLAAGAQNTFLYLAYQAMHSPIEAPPEYVQRCSHVTTENNRRIYCGMMLALDEGIGNVTETYKSLGIWDDTVLVLAADNGGDIGNSASNWPLRGEKWTNYEGGVRGVSFLHWPGLSPQLQGTVNDNLVHVADWLPTFVGGIAGTELTVDGYKFPLDGVNQWGSLTTPGAAGARSATSGLVHELGGFHSVPQQSYLLGKYKLIRQCPSSYVRYGSKTGHCNPMCPNGHCPMGWNPLPGGGASATPPPQSENHHRSALTQGGTWLFDVFADPAEHKDLSAELPEVVAQLGDALDKLRQRGIEQRDCPLDPLSNPKEFENVWTPWRGSKTPTCNAGGSNEYCLSPADGTLLLV